MVVSGGYHPEMLISGELLCFVDDLPNVEYLDGPPTDPTSKIMISLGVCHGERLPGRDSGTAEPRKGLGHRTAESGVFFAINFRAGEWWIGCAHPNVLRMSRILHDFTIVMHSGGMRWWMVKQYSTGPVSQCRNSDCINLHWPNNLTYIAGSVLQCLKRDVESSVVFPIWWE